jgi:hypothetical protein
VLHVVSWLCVCSGRWDVMSRHWPIPWDSDVPCHEITSNVIYPLSVMTPKMADLTRIKVLSLGVQLLMNLVQFRTVFPKLLVG